MSLKNLKNTYPKEEVASMHRFTFKAVIFSITVLSDTTVMPLSPIFEVIHVSRDRKTELFFYSLQEKGCDFPYILRRAHKQGPLLGAPR